jgi:septum formation protein
MLILGSSSPARLEILKKIGYSPDFIISPEVDETPLKKELPKNLSIRLACLKGLKIAELKPEDVIVSADTVVCVGRRVIDKCASEEEVREAISMLSGRSHRVYTTVCITNKSKQILKTSETRIKFKRLTKEEIENFVKSGEGIGKAGGYTISGIAESFILSISGSISGVMGLPSYEFLTLIRPIKF